MLQKACIDCSVWFLCSRQESRSEMAGLSSSRTRRWPTLAVRGSWHTPAHSDTLLAGQTVFLLIINAWIYWRLQTSITRTHCSKCIYYSTLFSWFSTIYNCYWIVVQGVPIKSDPLSLVGFFFQPVHSFVRGSYVYIFLTRMGQFWCKLGQLVHWAIAQETVNFGDQEVKGQVQKTPKTDLDECLRHSLKSNVFSSFVKFCVNLWHLDVYFTATVSACHSSAVSSLQLVSAALKIARSLVSRAEVCALFCRVHASSF